MAVFTPSLILERVELTPAWTVPSARAAAAAGFQSGLLEAVLAGPDDGDPIGVDRPHAE